MYKIFKYIIASFFVFILFSVPVYAIQNSSVTFISKSKTNTFTNSFNSPGFIFMEIFCGVIGIFMVILAIKATDDN